MLEYFVYSTLSKLFVIGLAVGCIYFMRRSLKQEWPKANPDAWKDKDNDW